MTSPRSRCGAHRRDSGGHNPRQAMSSVHVGQRAPVGVMQPSPSHAVRVTGGFAPEIESRESSSVRIVSRDKESVRVFFFIVITSVRLQSMRSTSERNSALARDASPAATRTRGPRTAASSRTVLLHLDVSPRDRARLCRSLLNAAARLTCAQTSPLPQAFEHHSDGSSAARTKHVAYRDRRVCVQSLARSRVDRAWTCGPLLAITASRT